MPKRSFGQLFITADGSEIVVAQYRRHDEQYLLACSTDSGELQRERLVSTSFPSFLEPSPNGKLLAYRASNHRVGLCEVSTFEPTLTGDSAWNEDLIYGDRNFPVDLSPDAQGKRLLCVGASVLSMWDVENERSVWSRNWGTWIRESVWLPLDGNVATVIGATEERKTASLLILDAENGKTVRDIPLDGKWSGPVIGLANGNIAACDDHSVYVFSPSGERLWTKQLGKNSEELSGIA